jgi:REP element-mobilizing transposase RayT
MNSFEYVTTDTEQGTLEQKETQTTLRVSLSVPAPEIKFEERITMPPPASEIDLEERSAPPVFTPQNPMEEVGRSSSLGDGEAAQLGAMPQISYELSYSCLLIPRFSDHYLSGDITEDLPRWLQEICISYGWRLGAIVIRPGYLQWIITVPLTANPAQFMRTTRQLTSQKILDEYPRFRRKNLSSDFWAPGFSVAPGCQFQSEENVSNFIFQIRKNQGIY